jgi:hypothetical protein
MRRSFHGPLFTPSLFFEYSRLLTGGAFSQDVNPFPSEAAPAALQHAGHSLMLNKE